MWVNLDLLANMSADSLCTSYQTELRHIFDDIAPCITITVTNRPSSPWFNGECRACRRRTRALEGRYRRSHLPYDYKTWSAALEDKRALFTLKEQQYWTRQLHDCAGDSRRLWRTLNSILMRDDITFPGGVSLTAQQLSEFFYDKVAKVRAATLFSRTAALTGPCTTHFDEFQPYSIDDIRRAIMQSPNKLCTLDPLPHSLLAIVLDDILPFLQLTCNTSLRDGVFSDCEKLAYVTPIIKKSSLDADCASNYRLVSNLSFLSKLIECLVCRQLTSYLTNHHLLAPLQSAYREHHSTETATLRVAFDVFNAADAGQVTVVALLDLSAAFYTADHDILLRRLNNSYGVGGTMLRWITSFLSNRMQVVNFDGG